MAITTATSGLDGHGLDPEGRIFWNPTTSLLYSHTLARAEGTLAELASALGDYRLPQSAQDRRFNMTWHDWINLANLVAVSQVIVRAAQARENSRGAHFRADFPEAGDLSTSTYTRVRVRDDGMLGVEAVPVQFTRVRPGETLL